MEDKDFRAWSRHAADWGADYRENLRDRPVRAQTKPGEIAAKIAATAPEEPEAMESIFSDLDSIIVPGMTHWQHPRFFAYFPANASSVSVIAEYLTSAMAAQCMLWQTSPAATELETRVLDWLRQAVGLPEGFAGVIQDSASSATLAAVLTMRERVLNWQGNRQGLSNQPTVRIYCSDQVHSSVDRAVWVSGIGADNLVRIPSDGDLRSMDPQALRTAIASDMRAGFVPAGIVASVGGTSTGGTDDIGSVCAIAREHGLYVHVDAAWAGSAMICPELRHYWAGVENADSVVFNPHKWLGVQFDCSAHFIRDPASLVRTLAMKAEYLKTYGHDDVINYSEWSVPLGRRFRALKLWFVLRAYGLEALRGRIRDHVKWSARLAERLAAEPDFELVTKPMLSLFSFRHRANAATDRNSAADDSATDLHNIALINRINDDGRIYLTQTRIDGNVAIRFQAGQFDAKPEDVDLAFDVICECARAGN